ncbi:MAG: MFS transporter [bacterium]
MQPQTSRRRAMADYYRFSLFNVISFSFLAGNIMVLYALRLGAGSILVGLIAASYQITFVFSLIGRRLIRRFGAVRLFGYFWIVRYLLMVPVVFTSLPALRDRTGLVLAVVTLCAFGFNISKGIGITATKPIVGEIPRRRERGTFLSNQHLITNLGAVATGTVMALVLGQDSPLWRYSLLLSVGILAGFGAAAFILRLPEPREAETGFGARFSEGLKVAFAPGPFRRLSVVNVFAVFVVSMVQAFLIVYFKRVYGYSDGTVVFFTVAGSLGGAVMATITRSVIDRVGAKPLLFAFLALLLLVLVPLIVSPAISGIWLGAFPALVFFFFVMSHFGIMNTADNYFFSITAAEHRLDLGIVFGVGTGIAGALGSFVGGIVLSLLEGVFTESLAHAFGAYFALAAAIMLVPLIRVRSLPDLDAYPIPDALGMLFSPRDIRAIRLLNRLRRSRTMDEERAAVSALGESTSRLPVDELMRRIGSPSLTIRLEAISALRNSPLTSEVEDRLIEEVHTHRYTTAHLAAELLGAARVVRAIPVLRDAVESHDYMVSAKSMVALAHFGDRDSIGRIESILEHSPNPRITIFAVKALEILGSVTSLPLIFRRIERKAETFVRDELILSSAALLGIFDSFYPLYVEFLDDRQEGLRSLCDLAPRGVDVCEALRDDPRRFTKLAIAHFTSSSYVVPAVRAAQVGRTHPGERSRARDRMIDVAPWFVDALQNRNVGQLERFRFFVGAVIVAPPPRPE